MSGVRGRHIPAKGAPARRGRRRGDRISRHKFGAGRAEGVGASVDDVRRRRMRSTGPAPCWSALMSSSRSGARPPAKPGWLPCSGPGAIWLTRLVYDRFADLLWAWNKRAGRWFQPFASRGGRKGVVVLAILTPAVLWVIKLGKINVLGGCALIGQQDRFFHRRQTCPVAPLY